jgi:hypothetical protein
MFEAFNLELDPVAKVTSMPEAGCEKLPRLLRALCLHAPLLSTRHHHCGVVRLHLDAETGDEVESADIIKGL